MGHRGLSAVFHLLITSITVRVGLVSASPAMVVKGDSYDEILSAMQ